VPVGRHVGARGTDRRCAVEQDAEGHRSRAVQRSHDEVDVTGVALERDAAGRSGQDGGVLRDHPPSHQVPPVQPEPRSRVVVVLDVERARPCDAKPLASPCPR
jgi:hypothetical protein